MLRQAKVLIQIINLSLSGKSKIHKKWSKCNKKSNNKTTQREETVSGTNETHEGGYKTGGTNMADKNNQHKWREKGA